jgi:hypothetical protein
VQNWAAALILKPNQKNGPALLVWSAVQLDYGAIGDSFQCVLSVYQVRLPGEVALHFGLVVQRIDNDNYVVD